MQYNKQLPIFFITAGKLFDGNEKYSIAKFDIGQYRTRFQLTIHDFNLQDIGIYKCVCKNTQSGRVEGDVKVVLQPGKQIVKKQKQ